MIQSLTLLREEKKEPSRSKQQRQTTVKILLGEKKKKIGRETLTKDSHVTIASIVEIVSTIANIGFIPYLTRLDTNHDS